jgi:hypothetical protein
MTYIPRTRRWLSVPARTAGRAGHRWQPPPSPPDPWAGESQGADIPPVAGWPSFRRIVPIPFGAWMTALERWQLTGAVGELRLGVGARVIAQGLRSRYCSAWLGA